jgi:hypothetical protein
MIPMEQVVSFTRQNTGTHFMDSGGESGRVWQRDAPTDRFTICSDGGCSISLSHLLAEGAEVVGWAQEAIEKAWAETDLNNFEVGPHVMEKHEFECAARNNTYNGEHDLDQEFVWEVWQRPGADDWIWDDDAIVLVYVHTGADVRGGYSYPIAVRFKCEYTIPELDLGFDAVDDSTRAWMKEEGLEEYEFSQGERGMEYRLHEAVGEFVRAESGDVLVFCRPAEEDEEVEGEKEESELDESRLLRFGVSYRGIEY